MQIKSSGKSMFPLISSGDKIEVDTKYDFDNVSLNSLVVFLSNNQLVTHRVLKKVKINSQNVLITKGDFNRTNDEGVVDRSNFIGVSVNISNNYYSINLNNKRFLVINKLFVLYSHLMKNLVLFKFFSSIFDNFSFFRIFIKIVSKKSIIKSSTINSRYLLYLLYLHKDNQLLSNCLWNHSELDSNSIFSEFFNNKMSVFFEHIIYCKNCKKHFSNEHSSLIKSLVKQQLVKSFIEKETCKEINNISSKIDINFIYLKKINPKFIEFNRKLHFLSILNVVGDDIDLLVEQKNYKKFLIILFLNKYFIDYAYLPLEVLLKHKKLKSDLDVHLHIILSRDTIFNSFKTKQLTNELFNCHKDNYIPIHYLLFTKVVRLWCNDFHKGLRKIYEIAALTNLLEDQDWEKLKLLSKKYQFYNELLVTLRVCKEFFDFTVFHSSLVSKSKINNYKINLVSKFFTLQWITDFTDVKLWWDENSLTTKKYLLQLHLIRIILNKHWIKYIIKPRVMLLIVKLFRV